MFLNCPAYLDQRGRPTMRAACRGQVPVHHAFHRRARGRRHDQVPGRPLLQRGHRVPHLGRHGQGRSGHCRRQLPPPGVTASRAVMMTVAVAAGPPRGMSPPSRGGTSPAEHRSRVLPGPPCRPVDHRHAPAPQAHHLRLPAGSRRQQRSPHPGLRRAPAQLTPQSSVRASSHRQTATRRRPWPRTRPSPSRPAAGAMTR